MSISSTGWTTLFSHHCSISNQASRQHVTMITKEVIAASKQLVPTMQERMGAFFLHQIDVFQWGTNATQQESPTPMMTSDMAQRQMMSIDWVTSWQMQWFLLTHQTICSTDDPIDMHGKHDKNPRHHNWKVILDKGKGTHLGRKLLEIELLNQCKQKKDAGVDHV